jgi:transposase
VNRRPSTEFKQPMRIGARALRAFRKRSADDDACLDHLMRVRFGEWFRCEKCGNSARYYRVKARRSFECERCGHQVYPTAGTPFARTRVPLRDWFNLTLDYAVSPDAVSAVNTQRRFGVTYKTAWRMVSTIQEHWATLIPLIQPRPRGRPKKKRP